MLGVWSFFRIFCFFLHDCLGGWSQPMWLVSCKRQGMLTQGLAPDPKCELNIASFLTLPHPLHCPISAKDILVTVLLLQVMGRWEGWGVVHQGLHMETGGRYHIFAILFCFCAVVNCSFLAGT